MQVAIESVSNLERKLKVSVPSDQINQEVNKRIKELTKKVHIKGFRPGKTPESVVKTRYRQSILEEVVRDVMWETLQQALQQEKLQPAGTPKVTVTQFKEDAPLEYEASFEVYPEVKWINLEGINIEKPVVEIKDADVDQLIENLRQQNVKWKEVDRVSQNGDQLVIDFEGSLEGEPFPGGAAKDFSIELGSNRMIPGFEEQLVGVTAGTKTNIDVNFPENYHAKDLAGKAAKFAIKVHKVSEPKLPALNDSFAKDLGVSEGTVAGLQQEVRDNMSREIDRRVNDNIKAQIVEKLLAINDIEIPQSLVETESKRLQEQLQRQYKAQTGVDMDSPFPLEQFSEQARKNVTIGLLLSQWIQQNNIEVDAAKVRKRIEAIASGYHNPEEIVNWYYSHKEAMTEVEAYVLEEQAIAHLLQHLNVVEKPTSYDEMMNPNRQGDK